MSRVRRDELALDEAPPVMGEVLQTCEWARELSGGWFDPWAMPGGVDPTGLVKGWAAQRAAAELRSAGIASAMVNAAGDIVALGEREPGRPWRVGVRDPRRPKRLAFIVPVEGAIATSAHYERRDRSSTRATASRRSGSDPRRSWDRTWVWRTRWPPVCWPPAPRA